MTDREVLLRAVCENPDDDLPRLVFADWLEEHGEPDRAEFIRVQCELARGAAFGPRADELRLRERQLLDEFAVAWAEPLRGLVSQFIYARGFVERVEMSLETPAEQIVRVFDLTPVRHVRDQNQFCDFQGVVDALPGMDRLTGLEFWWLYAFDDQLLGRILTSEHLANLRTLVLHHDRNGNLADDEVLIAGLMSPHRSNTVELAVNVDDMWRGPSDRVIRAMTESRYLGRVKKLDLSNTQMTDETVDALAAAGFFHRLEQFDLARSQLHLATWRRLLGRLRDGRAVERMVWLRLHDTIVAERYGTPELYLARDPLAGEFTALLGENVVDWQSVFVDTFNHDANTHPCARCWVGWEFPGRLAD
jgi:uncharacterized protein (TIGR02996 family)